MKTKFMDWFGPRKSLYRETASEKFSRIEAAFFVFTVGLNIGSIRISRVIEWFNFENTFTYPFSKSLAGCGDSIFCVDVGDGEGVTVGLGVAVGVGVGFLTATPLFHINFVPDLIQVNFLPCEVLIWPLVVHVDPALIAAKAGIVREDPVTASAITSDRDFFLTRKIVLSA
jgi:hypothetical protein